MCCVDAIRADVWNTRHRRARKERQCTECRGPIRRGARYLVVDCLADGSWAHYYVCDPCEQLTEWMQRDCDLVCYGALWDELFECIGASFDDLAPHVAGHALGLIYGRALR